MWHKKHMTVLLYGRTESGSVKLFLVLCLLCLLPCSQIDIGVKTGHRGSKKCYLFRMLEKMERGPSFALPSELYLYSWFPPFFSSYQHSMKDVLGKNKINLSTPLTSHYFKFSQHLLPCILLRVFWMPLTCYSPPSESFSSKPFVSFSKANGKILYKFFSTVW